MSEARVIVFIDGPYAGQYLRRYDPDYGDGRGLVEATSNVEEAKVFPSSVEAWEEWKRPSTVQPLRADGKPNRPMTAWTVTIQAPEEKILLP